MCVCVCMCVHVVLTFLFLVARLSCKCVSCLLAPIWYSVDSISLINPLQNSEADNRVSELDEVLSSTVPLR